MLLSVGSCNLTDVCCNTAVPQLAVSSSCMLKYCMADAKGLKCESLGWLGTGQAH